MKRLLLFTGLVFTAVAAFAHKSPAKTTSGAYTDAASFGFLPTESGINNAKALQKALDKGGDIVISKPGTYKLAKTVYIGDNTSLIFENGTEVEKVAEKGPFSQVILNKGALTRTFNHHITITGLTLKVNGVEMWMDEVYGLRGQIAFFYVKDLKIDHFRCLDLGKAQFCLHICTFEDVLLDDLIIKGQKDGIHFGKGKRFKISNAVFQTGDDAIALAAGDWVTANPEFGDIEDGVITHCYDLKAEKLEGAFAKIVASGWVDWKKGIEVRHGDAVVSDGRIYRVLAEIDGKSYKSVTPPRFKEGIVELDGIKWLMHQADTIHTAVVRHVTFRDIYVESLRVPFQLMCYDVDYSHSYYKGAPLPVQGDIALENITVLNDDERALVSISSPCDVITIKNSILRNNNIVFRRTKDFDVYPATHIGLLNCTFRNDGKIVLIKNNCPGKEIFLKTSGSMEAGKNFSAAVEQGPGTIHVTSDLPGFKEM